LNKKWKLNPKQNRNKTPVACKWTTEKRHKQRHQQIQISQHSTNQEQQWPTRFDPLGKLLEVEHMMYDSHLQLSAHHKRMIDLEGLN
jgi:hypothetical protein